MGTDQKKECNKTRTETPFLPLPQLQSNTSPPLFLVSAPLVFPAGYTQSLPRQPTRLGSSAQQFLCAASCFSLIFLCGPVLPTAPLLLHGSPVGHCPSEVPPPAGRGSSQECISSHVSHSVPFHMPFPKFLLLCLLPLPATACS